MREPEDREQLLALLHSAFERNLLDADALSIIEGALGVAEGNVAEAARILQTDRGNLYRRMRRLGILSESDTGSAGDSSAPASLPSGDSTSSKDA